MWLISPAEPRAYHSLGQSSTLPETLGADFLMFSGSLGTIGVQRKEVKDLVRSIFDGRVSKELHQMKGLDIGIWLIEGKMNWSSDGSYLGDYRGLTEAQYHGSLFSIQSEGFWVTSTSSQTETMKWLSLFEKWAEKPSHTSLRSRPGLKVPLGQPSVREQQAWVLTGLDGIGWKTALAIVDHFGGLPLQISSDLSAVPGIGKKTADRISAIFTRKDETSE